MKEFRLKLYEKILDLFPGMISVIDEDFRIVYLNQKLKERFGRDLEGKVCYEALYSYEEPCPWCKKDLVIGSHKSLVWEIKSPKDERWYQIRSIPLDIEGKTHYLSFIFDITEKKTLEKKVESQLKFFQEILERNPAVILFNQEGKLTFVNETFEEVTGYSREEVLGKSIFDILVPEEDADTWKKHAEEVYQGTFKKGVELPVKTKKGLKILLWNCMKVEDPNGIPTIVGLGVDITEKKQVFEQYLQAQKMESLGRFTGILLHELNNLFMALQGYLGVAKLKLSEPEKVKEYLERMETLIDRWRGMSQDLLAFARKTPGKTQLLDLAEFLNGYADTLSKILGNKISLEVSVPPKGYFVRMNPVHIQQILFNLASNSREAMPEGGKVRITLERVFVSKETASLLNLNSGPYLVLTFEDDGPGIPQEVLPYIFEPYFTTKESGSGLGLSTVYSLVKQYKGHIAVYSSPGQGTTFRIYLPEEIPEELKQTEFPTGTSVLLISPKEDPEVRDTLNLKGFRIYRVKDAKEALLLLKNGFSPDAIVMVAEDSEDLEGLKREVEKIHPEVKLFASSPSEPVQKLVEKLKEELKRQQ